MSQKDGLKNPKSKSEPGFRRMPVPGPNDLRPGLRDASPKWGRGREALAFVDGNRRVHNIGGAPDEWVATSPASSTYAPGLRKSPRETEADPTEATLQHGIKRH